MNLIAEARAWIADTFGDAPSDLTDAEVRAAVARHYDGGWAAFVTNSDVAPDGWAAGTYARIAGVWYAVLAVDHAAGTVTIARPGARPITRPAHLTRRPTDVTDVNPW